MRENDLPYFIFFSEGISALVEIPRNCVVAAVGKELSEYIICFLYVGAHFHVWTAA